MCLYAHDNQSDAAGQPRPARAGPAVTRRLALGGLAVAGLPLVAACGAAGAGGERPRSGAATTAPAALRQPATVGYMLWADKAEEDLIRQMAADLKAKQPLLTVDVLIVNSSDFASKLLAMAAAGTPPDCWQCPSDNYKTYVGQGLLLDLTPYTRRDQTDFADIYPFLTDAYRYKGGSYGWPFGGNTVVVYYNRDKFQREGLPDPNDLAARQKWDFAAFLDAGRRLTKPGADGAPAEWGIGGIGYWQPWIWAAGGELFDKDLTRCLLDEPKAIEGMQFEADLYARHQVAARANAERGGQTAWGAFDKGLAATHSHGTWQIDDRRNNAAFDWDIAPFPAGPRGDRATISPPGSIGISRESKVPDATWEWLKAYLGREAARTILTRTGSMAGSKQMMYRSVIGDPQVQAALKRNPRPAHLMVFAGQLPFARVRPLLPSGGPEINQAIDEQQTLLYAGKITAREAARAIVERVNPMLQKAAG